MKVPETVGKKDDLGFINTCYFDVYCNNCDNEVFNTTACQISSCPFCGMGLLPCSVCIDQVDCKQCDKLIDLQKQKPVIKR